MEKVGFARHVLGQAEAEGKAADDLDENFALLFAKLGEMQRAAERKRSQAGVGSRVGRLRDAFLQDHSHAASRSDLALLLEEIEAVLDDSLESDSMLVELRRIREEFVLTGDLTSQLEDFPKLADRLAGLRYQGILQSEPEAQGNELD